VARDARRAEVATHAGACCARATTLISRARRPRRRRSPSPASSRRAKLSSGHAYPTWAILKYTDGPERARQCAGRDETRRARAMSQVSRPCPGAREGPLTPLSLGGARGVTLSGDDAERHAKGNLTRAWRRFPRLALSCHPASNLARARSARGLKR
jgi:hypothetical protein